MHGWIDRQNSVIIYTFQSVIWLLYSFRRRMHCFNALLFLKLESFRLIFLYHPFRSTSHQPLYQDDTMCFCHTSNHFKLLPLCLTSVLMFILLLRYAPLETHTPYPSQKESEIYPLSVAKWEDYPFIIVSDAMPPLPLRQTNLFICLNLTGWAALMSQTQRCITVRVTGILGTRFKNKNVFF